MQHPYICTVYSYGPHIYAVCRCTPERIFKMPIEQHNGIDTNELEKIAELL